MSAVMAAATPVLVAVVGLVGVVAGALIQARTQRRADTAAAATAARTAATAEWEALSGAMQARLDDLQDEVKELRCTVSVQDKRIADLQLARQSDADLLLAARRHIGLLEDHITAQLPPPPPERPTSLS